MGREIQAQWYLHRVCDFSLKARSCIALQLTSIPSVFNFLPMKSIQLSRKGLFHGMDIQMASDLEYKKSTD